MLPSKISEGELLAMGYQLAALVCVVALVYVFLQRCKKFTTIKDVPGPVNPSWIFGMSPAGQPNSSIPVQEVYNVEHASSQGHQWYLQTNEAGGAEKRFTENFGNIVRWNSPFGVHLVCHRISLGTRGSVPSQYIARTLQGNG